MADGLAAVRTKYGPLAIAGAVSGAFFSRGLAIAQLTRAMGTPNWLINQDLCHGCRGVTEKMTGLNIAGGEDLDNAACVMIAGHNPQVADPPQWMALRQAKARDARLLVIDPFPDLSGRVGNSLVAATTGYRRMRSYGLAHMPRNYKVWYVYLSGTNAALGADIERAIEKSGGVTSADMDQLHALHFPGENAEAIDDIGAGHFPARPVPRSLCAMCPFDSVCRKQFVDAVVEATADE
jgi:hypothetical protein